VPEFLRAEWVARLDELAQAAPELADATDPPVIVEMTVNAAAGTVAFHLVLGPGPARVHPGSAPHADLTMIATEDAARRIHEGTANAQACLADGTMRLRGNPEVLTRRADVLARVGDLFAAIRR